MKKSTLLAFTAAVLFGSGVFHVNAASATYDDPLLLPNPAKAPTTGSVVLVPVASPQAVQSIHEFVKAWENAEKHIALAESKKNNHQALTKEEAKWLHSKDKHNYADYFRKHSLGYVHGQETALNWNGENRNKNEYSYYTFPKYDKDQGYTNSYGYNVLRSMVDRMNELLQKRLRADPMGTAKRTGPSAGQRVPWAGELGPGPLTARSSVGGPPPFPS